MLIFISVYFYCKCLYWCYETDFCLLVIFSLTAVKIFNRFLDQFVKV